MSNLIIDLKILWDYQRHLSELMHVKFTMIQRYYRFIVGLLKTLGAYKHRIEVYFSVTKKFVGGVSKLTIADIGCGSGIFSRYLSEGNFVVALDINRKPLEMIKGDVAVVCADAHNMPFKPESFDIVLSLSLMEHLENPVAHVEDLRKIVKRGGWLVLQLPNLQYFFEPHSKIPLLFLLPKKFQRLFFRKLEYSYVNMDLTIKGVLNLLLERGFTLRKMKKIYHVKCMRLIPWAPSYMFLLQRTG